MRFYVCELKSGQVIDEYPLEISQALTMRLKTYGTGEVRLPVLHPQCPTTWRNDLVPWRVLIVVCDDDDAILWAGIPVSRSAGDDPTVTLPVVTCEKYLDRRYMVDAEYEQEEQITIARDMVELCGDDVIGIGLDYDTTASGRLRDRSYYADEDARVLTRLQQLSNVIDGFEWRIDVEWADDADHSRVRKVFRTGYPTIGYVTNDPDHVFEVTTGIPGPIATFTHEESWGDGDAATLVQAAGDGQGEDKPYSVALVDSAREAAGWPRMEERQSQSGVIEQDTLDSAAQGIAERLFGGQSVVSFDAVASIWPTPADVTLGDTVRVIIDTDQAQVDEVWRIIGYSIQPDMTTWTPVIAAIGSYGEDEDAG